MRPIKFRAWDSDNAVMCHSDETTEDYIFCLEDGKLKCLLLFDVGATYDEPAHRDSRELETPLMQFTGLKDKSGREIYEGDIITFDRTKNDRDWTFDGKRFFPVAYREGEFVVDYGKCFKSLWGEVVGSRVVRIVCGNIYENPELLEVKQ